MNIPRVLLAGTAGLVAWLVVTFIGFLLAVETASNGAGPGRRAAALVAVLVLAASASAVATTWLLWQRHDRPGRVAATAMGAGWAMVFGVGGLVDGRAAGEPAWQAPFVLVLGVGLAVMVGWLVTGRGRSGPTT